MAVKKAPSVRWRPTPDQLMILDELFRGGLRTPTAQQIQKMTSQLKEYGKVECKNVFYWFQNHKAREKQKLRKKLHHHQQHLQHANNTLYYYLHPQYTYGFWPMLPARVIDGERVSQAERPERDEASDAYSSWPEISPLAGPESDSDHHQPIRRPLKTLQLFPTTISSTAEAAASSSSMSSSFSLM